MDWLADEPRRSAEWLREYFSSSTGIETAKRLAAANQALHDAWPYMDAIRWSTAQTAVSSELADVGLPADMRPNGVEFVLARLTAKAA